MSIIVQPGGIVSTRVYGLAPGLDVQVRIVGLLDATNEWVTEGDGYYQIAAPIPSDAVGEYTLEASPDGVAWQPDDETIVVSYAPPVLTDWTPTLDEIGAHLDARTLAGDERQHTFNEDTTPTGDQVLLFINDAIGIVQSAVGVTIPQLQYAAARYAVICRVAMAVERSEYADETDESDGAYKRWLDEYVVALASLSSAIDQDQPGRARFGSLPITTVTAESSSLYGTGWYL